MTSSIPALPVGSVEIRPAAEGDLAGIEALAERMLPPTYVHTGLLDATDVQDLIEGFWTAEYFSSIPGGDGRLWIVEADGRPHGDVTYPWCARSATEPIDLS